MTVSKDGGLERDLGGRVEMKERGERPSREGVPGVEDLDETWWELRGDTAAGGNTG